MSDHEKMEKEEKDGNGTSMSEIKELLSQLGDTRQYKVVLTRMKPLKLADGTPCDGQLESIESTDELDADRVREIYGGGTFKVLGFKNGEPGIKLNRWFKIAGAPKLPPEMLAERHAALPGNGNGHSDAIGLKTLDARIKEDERNANERKDRDQEMRKLIQEGAEAKAKAAALEAQMAELRQRPAEMLAMKTVEKDMTAIALTAIQQTARDQAEAHAREMASLRASKQEEQAPYRQYLHDVAKQQEQQVHALGKQYEMMMAMQQQQAAMMIDNMKSQSELARSMMQSQIDSMRSEMRELRANKDGGIMGDLDKFTSAMEKIMKIGGKFKDDQPTDIGSQIISLLGGLVENAPEFVRTLKMNPGAPAAGQLNQQQVQQAHQAQAQAQQDNDKEAALLLQTLRDAYARRQPVEELARTVAGRIGSGGVHSLLSQPPDQLVAAIQAQVTELSSPEGGQYLRDLRIALTQL